MKTGDSAGSGKSSCATPRPEVCSTEINYVCGERSTGITCVTTPCQTTEWATFSNACTACKDTDVSAYYAGTCEDRVATD